MDSNYVLNALGFHGQPLLKMWQDENTDLIKMNLQPNYAVYQERQKYFTFQDRAKRLKLHQFLARKATDLYDKQLRGKIPEQTVNSNMAIMPPFEVFVSKKQDKAKRCRCILEAIKPGDIVYGVVKKTLTIPGLPLHIKPLCTAEPLVRHLTDIPFKQVYVQSSHLCPLPLDKAGNPRSFQQNDIVCCEVLDISVDAERLNLGMGGVITTNNTVKLGLITPKDLPKYYRNFKANENVIEKYEEYLIYAKEFQNPNYDMLYEMNGISVNDKFTLMSALKHPFPPQDYAKELRQAQASKWAFRAVAEGIEHFKIGNHVEAFQSLNKALNIDPRNVEGLVARGALYANKGSFLKAVEDFEKALKLNEFHVNARKYMGETLVALGRSYEEENRVQDAIKAYSDCLKIIPNHEQARLSFDCLQQKPGNNLFDIFNLPENATDGGRQKVKKPRSSSSDSSAEDSSSNSSQSSGSDVQKKKNSSLSPLSRRLAMKGNEGGKRKTRSFNQPFYMSNPKVDVNEFKLDEDDTQSRVRKLLHEASKHKNDKSKKSKKKKTKKGKKERKEKHGKDTASNMLENTHYPAHNAMTELDIERKLAEIKNRQEVIQQQQSNLFQSESPPPPPSMKLLDDDECPAPPKFTRTEEDTPAVKANNSAVDLLYSSANPMNTGDNVATTTQPSPQKFSFQIRRPVKVDKFGLVRIATPLTNPHNSTGSSPRRERDYQSRSRSNSRGRSYGRRRRSSRSRSSSCSGRRRRGRRSRSRSRSHSRSRSRSPFRRQQSSRWDRGRFGGRGYNNSHSDRRFDNSFNRDRRNRSRSRDNKYPRRRESLDYQRANFSNRVWQRKNSIEKPLSSYRSGPKPATSSTRTEQRWPHDKFDEGPSIEEIDEIINQAQKERKQEIINRDKNILKKT